MKTEISRREFMLKTTLATGLTALGGVWTEGEARASRSPNEKLNIGIIGAGGQGGSDLGNVSSENIVALCDVDDALAADAFTRYPTAPRYKDFRKLLEQKDVEAVTVSTPDHTHAHATAMALKMGKHVYCQKPLTHSVYEARLITDLAAKHPKVATQMGTQGHAFPSHAKLVEMIQTGAIGSVREVHVVTDRPIWPQGMDRPSAAPVPATLDWDNWLGPRSARPYNPAYLPFVWRGWWDFGTGALGDMACHLMDPVFWSLKLGHASSVEAETGAINPDSAPKWSIIRYDFPKRGALPSVRVIWYDGGKTISPDLLEGVQLSKGFNGSLFIGDKGKMFVNHGEDPKLLPESRFTGYKAPTPFLPRSPGHHKEWIDACKGGTPTGSHFGYAGPMTEAILLGNVALRVGKKIEWDARNMKAKGCPEADKYIKMEYRPGWGL